ncbi:hypothetical protein CGRA01v4_14146 [Colletotrichum graminicola]|nr:hypothetical protein CGRA01v4_14146 [Colletotrichum graminicola]
MFGRHYSSTITSTDVGDEDVSTLKYQTKIWRRSGPRRVHRLSSACHDFSPGCIEGHAPISSKYSLRRDSKGLTTEMAGVPAE